MKSPLRPPAVVNLAYPEFNFPATVFDCQLVCHSPVGIHKCLLQVFFVLSLALKNRRKNNMPTELMTERQKDLTMVFHFFSVAQRTTLFSTTTLCRQCNVSHWAPLNSNLTSLPKSSYTAKLKPVWVQMRNRVAPKDVRLVKEKSELRSSTLTVTLLLDQ